MVVRPPPPGSPGPRPSAPRTTTPRAACPPLLFLLVRDGRRGRFTLLLSQTPLADSLSRLASILLLLSSRSIPLQKPTAFAPRPRSAASLSSRPKLLLRLLLVWLVLLLSALTVWKTGNSPRIPANRVDLPLPTPPAIATACYVFVPPEKGLFGLWGYRVDRCSCGQGGHNHSC